jgi:hypothetical protein
MLSLLRKQIGYIARVNIRLYKGVYTILEGYIKEVRRMKEFANDKCVICEKEFYEGMPIYTIKLPDKSIVAYCFEHKDSDELKKYISQFVGQSPIKEFGYVIELTK